MPFNYYHRLSRRDQRAYRESDGVATISLPRAGDLASSVQAVRSALGAEDRPALRLACQEFVDAVNDQLHAPPSNVRVLAARPSRNWGELHGLYEPLDGTASARITVWMRTAKRRQVVAFRSFFRTVLHELCHHLDYEHLALAESFHTEGFFKRESSLFHQLVTTDP
ncbi:MAG: hypothetical protein OES47_10515 [Acidobacteriota bacterium]|nr:hypothetical protein [Acidobacteriota bacterium]